MDFLYKLSYTEDGVDYDIVVDAWHHKDRDITDVLLDECSGKGDVWTNIYAVNENDERLDDFDHRLPGFLLAEKVKDTQENNLIDQDVKNVQVASEAPAKGKVLRITRAVIDMFRTPFD